MKINNLTYQTYKYANIGPKNVQKNIKDNKIYFGYHSVIKDLFKEDKLPSVKHGLYGDILTKDNVSLEHLIPHSYKNGKSELCNFALASKQKNNLRGNSDIRDFLTPEMAKKYLNQFVDIKAVSKKNKKFNGNNYIDMIKKTLKQLGIVLD